AGAIKDEAAVFLVAAEIGGSDDIAQGTAWHFDRHRKAVFANTRNDDIGNVYVHRKVAVVFVQNREQYILNDQTDIQRRDRQVTGLVVGKRDVPFLVGIATANQVTIAGPGRFAFVAAVSQMLVVDHGARHKFVFELLLQVKDTADDRSRFQADLFVQSFVL